MASASSAQREPSMEEILASIRRIIEDSDSGRKQPEEASEMQAVESDEDEAPVPVVDAFRAELHAVPEESKPVTLADMQEQLTSTPAQPMPASRPVSLAEIGAQIATGQEAANADAITASWQRDIAAAGQPAQGRSSAVAAELEQVDAEPDDTATPVQDTYLFESSPEPSQPVALSDEVSARPTLVSEQTSRQVAAAFGELSDAFASRGRKSFDEMAEEMLRPMLQDWLDNNLPTLVERLVREEIERVARGG